MFVQKLFITIIYNIKNEIPRGDVYRLMIIIVGIKDVF